MLNYKHCILLFLLLVSATECFSQRNSLKLGVLGAAAGDFSIAVEQIIHTTHSVNYTVGYWNNKNSLINLDYFFPEGRDLWFRDKSTGWHGAVEMRNYFNIGTDLKKKLFYWGPYFRLWKADLLLNDFISNDFITNQQLFDVDAKIKGIGFGVQFGYHVLLTNRLWLDFYFMGFGVDFASMKATYNAFGVDQFDYSLIENDVKETFSHQAKFIKSNVHIQHSSESLLIDLPVTLPVIRAGINIAYVLD